MLLPCENDQAKLDHFSRLACSTNLSKILPALRLSGAVWIEAQAFTGVSSNLLRYRFLLIKAGTGVFARTF
jgi:hypothetical protein